MDDGNRQLAISLGLNPEQFEALDTKLGGIDGAINRLAENISAPDTSVAAEISLLRNEVSKWRTELDQAVVLMTQSITLASENIGKWLAAIAIAAANPNDNSAEIQRQIDEVTAQLNTSTAELKGEIDQQTKEK